MLNIADLEKRWFKYKLKSYIPHLSIFVSLIVITLIFITFPDTTQELTITATKAATIPVIPKDIVKIQEQKTTIKEPLVKDIPISIVKEEPIVINSTKGVKLSPSLDFMKKMQNSMQPYYQNDIKDNKQAVYQAPEPKVEVIQHKKASVVEYIPEVQVKKIMFKRQNTQNDIFEIITRFKKNNNPALSLFVAKKYYELQDYQQAYNYALITNKINKEIESSWIIFTKSLVKLGKREKAISILKRYIKQSHSSTARILLDEIYAGRFK